MEEVKVDIGLEDEVRISRRMKETGKTRDEVIAEAVSHFLCVLGFENLGAA